MKKLSPPPPSFVFFFSRSTSPPALLLVGAFSSHAMSQGLFTLVYPSNLLAANEIRASNPHRVPLSRRGLQVFPVLSPCISSRTSPPLRTRSIGFPRLFLPSVPLFSSLCEGVHLTGPAVDLSTTFLNFSKIKLELFLMRSRVPIASTSPYSVPMIMRWPSISPGPGCDLASFLPSNGRIFCLLRSFLIVLLLFPAANPRENPPPRPTIPPTYHVFGRRRSE